MKKSLKITLLILLVFTGNCLKAQTNLDSLYTIWEDRAQPDSIRVNAYEKYIVYKFMLKRPDSAFSRIDSLYQFSKTRGYQRGIAKSILLRGNTYHFKSDFDQALFYFEEALVLNLESNDLKELATNYFSFALTYSLIGDYGKSQHNYVKSLAIYEKLGKPLSVANVYNNIGLTYENQGNYIKALEYYQNSIKIRSENSNDSGNAPVFDNIGTIYREQGEFDLSREYYKKGLAIFIKQDNKRGIAHILGNIGVTYRIQKEYEQAFDYFQRGLKVCEEMGNKFEIATAMDNLGVNYHEQGQLDIAQEYYSKGLVIREEIADKAGIVNSLIHIGTGYFGQSFFNKSILSCKKALRVANEINALLEQKKSCDCIYKGYKKLGNSKEAFFYLEEMLRLNDSLNEVDTAKELMRMEFAKKVVADSLIQVEKDLRVDMAHQDEVQKKEVNRNIAIGAGIFFLLLAGGFFIRWKFVKKSKAVIEKEKERSDNLLLNILPSEIAEELKIKGRADARDFDKASILFTDFKDFTETSEKLSAKELLEEINYCFKGFDYICEKYKIEKIKTIGDAYMAVGGLPIPSEDSVKNTILAALEMQEFISERIKSKQLNNEIPFEMRVGIHTGPVVAGIVGVKKFQYDIWGDTVNTASRMESSGDVGKVNISESTYTLLKNDPDFTFKSRGKIKAKGKGEIEMYFVTKRG